MKFKLPDSGNAYQEVTIRETDNGVQVDFVPCEDVTDLIEGNKRLQNEGKKVYLGNGTQTSMYQLGSLGAVQAHELIKKGIFQDDKALRKWFEDLDNYLFRVAAKKRRGS